MLTAAQRQEFSRAELALDDLSVRRLRNLLRTMDEPGSDRFIRDLLEALPYLVDELADVSAAIGAAAYDLSREQSGARAGFAAVFGQGPSAEWVRGVARVAVFTRGATEAGRVAPELIGQRLEASVPRVVRFGGRSAVARSASLDPARPRFARVVRANGCDFCKLLGSRTNYLSREAAGDVGADWNRFHDHCHCRVEPVFRGESIPLLEAA